MRPGLSLKSLYRTPLKTLLTFLLLAATSYMLFFSIAEYAVTSREYARAAGYYNGIGGIETEELSYPTFERADGNPYDYTANGTDFHLYLDSRVENDPYSRSLDEFAYAEIRQSDIDAIMNLPYVTDIEVRYMTAGIVNGLRRTDNRKDYYNHTARFIAEGTFETLEQDDIFISQHSDEYWGGLTVFNDVNLIAGDPYWIYRSYRNLPIGEPFKIALYTYAFQQSGTDGSTWPHSPHVSTGNQKRYHAIIHYDQRYYNEVYDLEYLESLVPGERYLFIGRLEPPAAPHRHPDEVLSDTTTIGWWPQIYPLSGLPDNYLELDEFAPLRELIEITENDLNTFDIVYTHSMSHIMRVADQSLAITSGRALNREDFENNRNVCVISQSVMRLNSLQLGDKISIGLGDKLFEQDAVIGTVASVRERYPDVITPVEFEIVGIYTDIEAGSSLERTNPYRLYSDNTIFIPASFLPMEIPDDHIIKPGEFSFIIGDARNISPFLEKYETVITDELGLTLYFSDSGWAALERQLSISDTLTLVRLPIFSATVLIAIGLTVYLFIGRKRKEYAIMRALGTIRSLSARSLYIPFGLIAIFALIAGNTLAFFLAGGAVEEALSVYKNLGLEVNSSIPISTVFISIIFEIAALTLITMFGLRRIGKQQPLALLQAATNRNAGKSKSGASGGRQTGVDGGKAAATTTSQSTTAVTASQSIAAATKSHMSDADTESQSTAAATINHSTAVFSQNEQESLKPTNRGRFICRYVGRRILRSPIRSLLSIGLALLLMGTIGQFTIQYGIFKDLYDDIAAKVYFYDELFLDAAIELNSLEYITNPYYEHNVEKVLELNYEPIHLVMTNDIERYGDSTINTEFLEGYDYSSFSGINRARNTICLLEKGFMEEIGVEIGDTVWLNMLGRQIPPIEGFEDMIPEYELYIGIMTEIIYDTLTSRWVSMRDNISDVLLRGADLEKLARRIAETTWFGNFEQLDIIMLTEYDEDTDPLSLYMSGLLNFLSAMISTDSFAFYTVVGSYESDLYSVEMFVPVGSAVFYILPRPDAIIKEDFTFLAVLLFDYIEYTLVSPVMADDFTGYIRDKGYSQIGQLGMMSVYTMNTDEADNMYRTLNLIRLLYPLAIVIAIILGGLFPGLIVMQSDKDASLYRALGTTKRLTRIMFIIEQAFLCLIGLLLACILLLILNGYLMINQSAPLTYYSVGQFFACVAGASIFAVIISQRKVLDLLQVKE